MKKSGPKSPITKWCEPDNLIVLRGWARQGLTDEQIAHNMGIHVSTLYVYKNKSKEINEALKRSKIVVDYEVENALLKKALGYTITLSEDKLDRDGCVHTLKKEVHVPPDTTAQIFWLKNRQKDQWRERVELPTNPQELDRVEQLLQKLKQEANK